jgi:hypothetical protein
VAWGAYPYPPRACRAHLHRLHKSRAYQHIEILDSMGARCMSKGAHGKRARCGSLARTGAPHTSVSTVHKPRPWWISGTAFIIKLLPSCMHVQYQPGQAHGGR